MKNENIFMLCLAVSLVFFVIGMKLIMVADSSYTDSVKVLASQVCEAEGLEYQKIEWDEDRWIVYCEDPYKEKEFIVRDS